VTTEIDSPAFDNPIAITADATNVAVLNAPGYVATTLPVSPSSPSSLSVLTVATGAITTVTTGLASAAGLAMDASTYWVVTTSSGTYADGALVMLNRVSLAQTVVNSPFFVHPSLVTATGADAYVVGSSTIAGDLGGKSPGEVVVVRHAATTPYTSGILPPSVPASNAYANPQYNGQICTYSAKYVYVVTPECTGAILQAINAAHATEHIRPMVLPSNWAALSPAEHVFVAIDLERVGRGLPPYVGLNTTLTAAASAAASAHHPAALPRAFPDTNAATSIWAGDYSALSLVYSLMYVNGWGGSLWVTTNGACATPHAAGCWAMRRGLLGGVSGYPQGVGIHCTTCEMGVGYAIAPTLKMGSYAILIERPTRTPPAMTFTWAKDVRPYLLSH
jgi:hypothetical protein